VAGHVVFLPVHGGRFGLGAARGDDSTALLTGDSGGQTELISRQ
jgi:hypothetical protein